MNIVQFNRHEMPAGGGWTFRQVQTGWTNPYAMVGFDASVKAIISHRKGNPAITAKYQLSTDYTTVANELERYTRLRLGIPDPPSPSFFQQGSNRLPSRVLAVAADIKKAAQGTAVALDWIQSGGDPVPQDLAERRAEVCASCPRNVPGSWYTEAPAELLKAAIKGWQTLKGSNFSFETKQGDRVKSCDVCKCLMRLKVFCPLPHVLSRTPPEILAEFPPNCWIYRRDA